MDPVGTQRTAAAIADQLSARGVTPLPVVGGNAKTADPFSPRSAAEADSAASAGAGDNTELRTGINREFSAEELAEIRELRNRDREVRAHEQAHLSAAGPHARGGASFTYEVGPDGKRYAVGGEVSIDSSEAGDPSATLAKAQQIRRAALAPADPSAQDRQVAAEAASMATRARAELAEQQRASSQAGPVGQAYSATSADSGTLINLIA
ncbi:MAG: putative metalloprotease CJM1_0395 family protein [Gammaproteobacteria bacterium]|nr:putative metalloprotease CJM1_0395 family protein [Gammaproteobacteria bacterium]